MRTHPDQAAREALEARLERLFVTYSLRDRDALRLVAEDALWEEPMLKQIYLRFPAVSLADAGVVFDRLQAQIQDASHSRLREYMRYAEDKDIRAQPNPPRRSTPPARHRAAAPMGLKLAVHAVLYKEDDETTWDRLAVYVERHGREQTFDMIAEILIEIGFTPREAEATLPEWQSRLDRGGKVERKEVGKVQWREMARGGSRNPRGRGGQGFHDTSLSTAMATIRQRIQTSTAFTAAYQQAAQIAYATVGARPTVQTLRELGGFSAVAKAAVEQVIAKSPELTAPTLGSKLVPLTIADVLRDVSTIKRLREETQAAVAQTASQTKGKPAMPTKKKRNPGATVTAPCPICKTKVIVQTKYCVRCKKKTLA